jgi:hypothetical protein
MPSITLASLLCQEAVDLRAYDALVLDTQGAELRVLRGAGAILDGFRFLKLEVPDFEAYRGCCLLPEVQRFLQARGWREHARHAFGYHPAGGCYFDVVYRRRRPAGA